MQITLLFLPFFILQEIPKYGIRDRNNIENCQIYDLTKDSSYLYLCTTKKLNLKQVNENCFVPYL